MFRFALSMKLGAILLLPGYLFILVVREGPLKALLVITLMVASNVLLALPFLLSQPQAYFRQAFDFGRLFHAR